MEAELKNTVALVTGASGGIGRATAVELARRGADVAVHYLRNEAGAAETAPRSAGRAQRPLRSGRRLAAGRGAGAGRTPSSRASGASTSW